MIIFVYDTHDYHQRAEDMGLLKNSCLVRGLNRPSFPVVCYEDLQQAESITCNTSTMQMLKRRFGAVLDGKNIHIVD